MARPGGGRVPITPAIDTSLDDRELSAVKIRLEKKLDISGSLKAKINKSNNKNEAGFLIRARRPASMGLRSCYPLKLCGLKYLR
jgi:hypothetical protein